MSFEKKEFELGFVHYERRIVSFFDILGWHSHIVEAGDDPKRIALLASVLRLFSKSVTSLANPIEGAYISSFSDNVVVSVPYHSDHVLPSLEGLASVLVGAACMGFLIRGAITIGNLFHDDDIVFGPALNRAHELESKQAIYSLALLDPLISDFTDIRGDFICTEEEKTFLDPFNCSFIDRKLKSSPESHEMKARWAEKAGVRIHANPKDMSSEQMIYGIFLKIQYGMEKAPNEEGKKKYAWLHKRLSQHIQVLESSHM